MVLRRLLVVGVLTLMVVLGTGAITLARTAERSHADESTPCAVQIECAGGIAAAAGALLLVMPAVVAAGFAPLAPARRVLPRPTELRSALLADKLFRPPQGS